MTPQLRNITDVTLRLRCEFHDTDLENSAPSVYPHVVVQKDWRNGKEWSFTLGTLICPKRGQGGLGDDCKEHWRVWYHPRRYT